MSISLQKGQKISLSKEASGLTKVRMGLGWDAVKSSGLMSFFSSDDPIDLDATCVMCAGTEIVDVVWFRQLKSKDGSVSHSGDNRTGEGDGDDETITIDLNRVPETVTALVFTVNSFTGQDFSKVANAFCRLVDDSTGKEIAKYNLSEQGSFTGQIMAKLYRHNGEWKLHAIGENGRGRTFDDMMGQISTVL